MTSDQIRQSYLEFFRERGHTVVPSASLLPTAPNLLFTNSGMNPFVPIFLGDAPAPNPPRVADTQKCIRAGGKHNDLEDVGLDTYHHTFFEMLGNWSFGDYFKQEAIAWAWELLVNRWKFPADRVYATVYQPGADDPSHFDQEAYDHWEKIFRAAGLDPKQHIVPGGRKDNFWMMGDTGPCGPCSELHIDLTPDKSGAKLVNKGDPRCIEIWNLVFIQFNATSGGAFEPLTARHVDTGMGLERVASIVQGTKNFTDFSGSISNYDTDLFRPLFDALEKISGKKYQRTLPAASSPPQTPQEKTDVAFRVIGDHLRCLAFAIADGITPSNEGRGYVLRRILRRAVRYGRELGLQKSFLAELAPTLCSKMSDAFPELRAHQSEIEKMLLREEESFGRTIDRGIKLFEANLPMGGNYAKTGYEGMAFELYDTYGFPLDLTQLMARERGIEINVEGFERHMAEQRQRSQAAQKKQVIEVSQGAGGEPTLFIGYEELLTSEASVTFVQSDGRLLGTDRTPFYPGGGGQVADKGKIIFQGTTYTVEDVDRSPEGVIVHRLDRAVEARRGDTVTLSVNLTERNNIQAHHTATHLLHWALREKLGKHIAQKGSYVGPDRLRFDFSHPAALTESERMIIEETVREKIGADDIVQAEEHAYITVQKDPSILQFFGDKYGERVRVVQIGAYSKELCGGTHVKRTGEIGFCKILSEGAIASGVRRIEMICGASALNAYLAVEAARGQEQYAKFCQKHPTLCSLAPLALNGTANENWEAWDAWQAAWAQLQEKARELEKEAGKAEQAAWQKRAAEQATEFLQRAEQLKRADGTAVKFLAQKLDATPAGYLPVLAELLRVQTDLVAVLGASHEGKAALLVVCGKEAAALVHAGNVLKALVPLIAGKGGGRPDLAQGGGTDPAGLDAALAKANELVLQSTPLPSREKAEKK